MDTMLKVVRDRIFEELKFEIIPASQRQAIQIVKQLLHCYHVVEEKEPKEDNLCNIHIPKVEDPKMDLEYYVVPLKIKKVIIGIADNPKMASIGDYWDHQSVERITELLCEYIELFPANFSEMKGLAGELGEMKIPLKPKERTIRKRPYRLNPIYKEKEKI
jgi:hypothetical protein